MRRAFFMALAFLALLAISLWQASAQQAAAESVGLAAKLICPFYTLGGITFAFPNMDTSTTVIDFRSGSYTWQDSGNLDIKFTPFPMGGPEYIALPSISQRRNESFEAHRLSLHSE